MKDEVFDTDKYIDRLNSYSTMAVFKAPNNKVPVNNLPKLAPEKKTVPIKVSPFDILMLKIDVALGDFVLRDRFDWDLN